MAVPGFAAILVIVQLGLGITNILTRATVWSAIGHLTIASWFAALSVTAAPGLLIPRAVIGRETDRRPLPRGHSAGPPAPRRDLEEVVQ